MKNSGSIDLPNSASVASLQGDTLPSLSCTRVEVHLVIALSESPNGYAISFLKEILDWGTPQPTPCVKSAWQDRDELGRF